MQVEDFDSVMHNSRNVERAFAVKILQSNVGESSCFISFCSELKLSLNYSPNETTARPLVFLIWNSSKGSGIPLRVFVSSLYIELLEVFIYFVHKMLLVFSSDLF